MIRLALALTLVGLPAAAQIRDFSCVGAERLEDDSVAIPFPTGRDRVAPPALSPLEDLVATARAAASATSASSASPARRKAARKPAAASPPDARATSAWNWPSAASSATASVPKPARAVSWIRRTATAPAG
jgi:hypothetical protein